jgi:hypothetical protein
MESRQEPRFEVDQEISVTLLGDAETIIRARIVNVSSNGMGLESSSPLPPGGALKIELADTLFLGEVAYCRPRGTIYQVGIALDQALHHTRGLAAMAKSVLGGMSGQRAYTCVKGHDQDG